MLRIFKLRVREAKNLMSPKNVIKIEVIDEDEIEEQQRAAKTVGGKKEKKVAKKKDASQESVKQAAKVASPKTVKTVKKTKKASIKRTVPKQEEVEEVEKDAETDEKKEKPAKTTRLSVKKLVKKEIQETVNKEDSEDSVLQEKEERKDDQVKISEIKEPAELETKKPLKKINLKKKKEAVLSEVDTSGEEDVKVAPVKNVSKTKEPSFEQILNEKSSKINKVIKESIVDEQEKMEERVETKHSFVSSKRSIKLYRRLAYFFIFLTVALVAVVGYYSIVRVEIVLIPNQERISNNLIFDIKDKDLGATKSGSIVLGIVKEIDIEKEKSYTPSGEEVIGKEVIGDVVIYNNYSKNQPLVASTRLLSSDGKLYRLKQTVNVPAGGQISALIYADDPDEDMVVQATRFNIPGLWAGLQDKIFAESKEATVFQKKINRYVAKDDFETSERDLKQLLLVAAKEKVNEEYRDYSQILYKIDENSIESEIDAELGDEIDSYDASMKASVVVVAFDNQEAVKLAKQKFTSSISDTKEIISFEDDKVIYSLNSFDIENGSAAINAQFSGKVSLKNDSEIIDIDKIVGLNKGQLETYLSDIKDIAGYEVSFRPSFIKRVPTLADRINIKIKR